MEWWTPGAEAGRGRNKEFNGDKVSVGDDEEVLEMDADDETITLLDNTL